MNIKIDNINFHLLLEEDKLKRNLIPVVFLHGFSGSSNDWKFIFKQLPSKFFPVAIDLIGHGKSDSPSSSDLYATKSIVKQLDNIFLSLGLNKIILCGYSMGGRVAISYAVTFPKKIKGLILESTTPGIADLKLRKKRYSADVQLAKKITEKGLRFFFDEWFEKPLFQPLKNLPVQTHNKLKNERLNNSIIGLSKMLTNFSTGKMPSYWAQLNMPEFPVLLLTGSLDVKFTEINLKMVRLINNAEHIIVHNSGHNIHFEKPQKFINFIVRFLEKF